MAADTIFSNGSSPFLPSTERAVREDQSSSNHSHKSEEVMLELSDIIDIIRRHIIPVVLTIVLCVMISVLIATVIPKRYKAKAILDIPSSYFRNPLVSELISEVNDPTELNAQRIALLRLALNDDFLDTLGEKYQLFKLTRDNPKRQAERDDLFRRIEYFSINTTSFQIGLVGDKPRLVYEMLSDVLDQMTYTLIEERYRTLTRARDAIQTQVEFLSRALSKVGTATPQADFLRGELQKIESNIAALRTKYTETHPELYKLKKEAESVRSRLKGTQIPSSPPEDDLTKAFITPNTKAPIQDIYNDLLRKLSHLNIILEMEKDRSAPSYLAVVEKPAIPPFPAFPDKKAFMAIGLLAGLVIAVLQVLYYELQRGALVSAEQAAELLGVPLLGEMPILVKEEQKLLLTGPVFNPASSLPAPADMKTPSADTRKTGSETNSLESRSPESKPLENNSLEGKPSGKPQQAA